MNGKVCIVTGFDRSRAECRVHCRILDAQDAGGTTSYNHNAIVEGTSVKLKGTNLIPEVLGNALAEFMERTPQIPDNELLARLEVAIDKHDRFTDREDLAYRLNLYRTLRDNLRDQPAGSLSDKDYCFPCGAGCELLYRGANQNKGVIMAVSFRTDCGKIKTLL
jgi:hypothetical protein